MKPEFELAVQAVRTMEDYLAEEVAPFRFSSLVVGALSAATTLLAMFGNYGMTALVVSRRKHELGVRAALGATRASVVRLVLRRTLAAVITGLACGSVGAAVLEPQVRELISAAGTRDAVPVTSAVRLCAIASLVAAAGPSFAATRMNLADLLRDQEHSRTRAGGHPALGHLGTRAL